jgi:uncharacterized membrane protein YccC
MPNVESLGWLLPPFAVCFGAAAWLLAGSSQIAYVGLQAGYAFGIATLDAFGPATDLAPPANRVLGVLLGIAVMGFVYHWIWPVRASRAMRPALGSALRAMAMLAEVERVRGGYGAEVSRLARHRAAVYRGLATVLRLREDSLLEPGAGAPQARVERDRILALTGDAQGVFLALLALARHRLATAPGTLPAAAVAPLGAFDHGVRRTLEIVADTIEGNAAASPPDMRPALGALERTAAGAMPPAPVDTPPPTALEREVAIRRYILGHIERLSRLVSEDGAHRLAHGGLG